MKIAIVGTGNVAYQMGRRLSEGGMNIIGVLGRDKAKAQQLASFIHCEKHDEIQGHNLQADVYIIAVKDQAIQTVAQSIDRPDATLIHTSGSTDMDVLGVALRAVIWPLYSIRKKAVIQWLEIPLITEASTALAQSQVEIICEVLSGPIYHLDSTQRAHAHLLAVFINNFSKHMFYLIGEHQSKMGIDPKMYEEILSKTLEKIGHGDAQSLELKKSLTGPARRNDQNIIKKHLSLLPDNAPLKSLYKTFTESIIDTYYGEELQRDS